MQLVLTKKISSQKREAIVITTKDGPSAGITIYTALYSLLSNKKIRQDIAMTGEITLKGRVLEIGGIKEKLTAAVREGIKEVIIPKDNERDLAEIPEEIKKALVIHPVIPIVTINAVYLSLNLRFYQLKTHLRPLR